MLNTHGANRIVLTDPNTGKEYKQDSNEEIALLTLTAAGANANGPDVSNLFNVGAVAAVDITGITGTGASLTVVIEGKIGNRYYTILQSAALTVIGTTILRIHPSLTAAANTIAKDVIPGTMRARAVIAGTTPSITATVTASLV